MEKFQRFRRETLAITLGLALMLGSALSLHSNVWAGAFVLGVCAGMAGFLLLARSVSRYAGTAPEQLGVVMLRDMLTRMGVYGLTLFLVWRLGEGSRETLALALCGILLPRVVMYGVAMVRLRGGA